MYPATNYFLLKKPICIPCIISIHIAPSVTKMEPAPEFETKEGNLAFLVSPSFMVSTSVNRKLAFSKEKEVLLNFSYLHVGTIKIDHEDIYLFLEKK